MKRSLASNRLGSLIWGSGNQGVVAVESPLLPCSSLSIRTGLDAGAPVGPVKTHVVLVITVYDHSEPASPSHCFTVATGSRKMYNLWITVIVSICAFNFVSIEPGTCDKTGVGSGRTAEGKGRGVEGEAVPIAWRGANFFCITSFYYRLLLFSLKILNWICFY